MNNLIKYISEPLPWRGMKICFLGFLIATPAVIIRILFKIENIIFVNISIIFILFGFAISIIGMANHFKWFIEDMKSVDEGYKVKQPWEKE